MFVRSLGIAEGVEWGFFLPITVFWIVELDLGPLELVFMGLVLELSVLLAETPTGVVADLVSRKRSIVIAQVVMGIGFIWAVASTNYWVILPAQALFGVGWTFRSGADTAWVTDELRGRGELGYSEIDHLLLRRHRFGIVVALVTIVVSIVVGEATSVRWAVVLMGLLQIGIGVYCAFAMSEDHFVPGRERHRGFVATLRDGVSAVAISPRLRVIVVVLLLLDMGAEAFDRLGFKHFLDSASVDDRSLRALGLLFLALALAGLAANIVTTRALTAGRGLARVAFVLLLVATIGGAIASATSVVVVIAIGYMLQDSMRESVWPVIEGWANRDAPTEVRATVHSLMGQTTAIGELIGGLMLGLVAEATTIPVSLAIAAGFFGTSTLISTRGFAGSVGDVG